ncbi:DUF3043 domain-containing protein [Tomitella gaofuii]|uniref:DUF3043 domain-containing protein n=1 Tax=Tomitella gaofuii TaxID=2760083 RepID=UPI002E28BFFB|nr:DUF3043 domain-containing protein [Tomitella gaofuii]
MKFLRRGASDAQPTPDDPASDTADSPDDSPAPDTGDASDGGSDRAGGGRVTEGKGRPTPKRNASEKRRGPVGPAPMTAKEARARRRTHRDGSKKSREERKAESAERRVAMADRRERMMAGEEKFLPARDRGPERRYVRNIVDSRRHLVGLFMPLAIVMILSLFLAPNIQALVSLFMLIMVVLMMIEGFFLSRRTYARVAERYPDVADSRFSLGWYAFVRASQLRRMRTPRPEVSVGDEL